MTKLVATAKNINDAHRLARSTAESAVEHAIECGRLLAAKKAEMEHGEFTPWVEKHCEFTIRSAQLYMKAAEQKRNALRFSSLRELLAPPEPREPKAAKPAPRTFAPDSPKGAVSVVNPKGTEETGDDRPAAPVSAVKPAEPEFSERWEPEDDEDAQLEQAEKEYAASIDKVMSADDKLAAAHAEIKRQAAEIASLKLSRNGYQNRCDEILRRYKAAQRTIEKLEKQIGKRAA